MAGKPLIAGSTSPPAVPYHNHRRLTESLNRPSIVVEYLRQQSCWCFGRCGWSAQSTRARAIMQDAALVVDSLLTALAAR